ncbi:hypothetical protein OAO01_08690, partial [Oligoflexia bacterium]|nr:hypothetical protein [Oligoflexia bacterium]
SKPIAVLPLANIVYGPSYVSSQSLLSYYGLIPEAVKQITSVNTKKTKKFKTAFGVFQYRIIPFSAFGKGVVSIGTKSNNFIGATCEKALLDLCYLAHATDLFSYATESLRIEPEDLVNLDRSSLAELFPYYKSKQFSKRVENLIKDL